MLFFNFLLINKSWQKGITKYFFLLIRSWSLTNDSQQSHFAIEFAYLYILSECPVKWKVV